ncbi:MAG: hypothetical protein L0323_18840 [Planctomycetes bacterium]|nr:hypothetical protein [Planctomycetota bacterium]
MTPLVAWGVSAVVAVPVVLHLARAQESRPGEDRVAAQRARNEAFFQSDYLERREGLVARHAGGWIAIVAGEATSPAETLADCLRAADARDPKALHRFVFRIGEEGPVAYRLGGAGARNLIGMEFFGRLDIRHVEFKLEGAVICRRGEKTKVFPWKDLYIPLPLGEPGGTSVRPIRVSPSTAFTGVALLEPAVADELGLARFEIPGEVPLEQFGVRFVCRRARVRVQIPELEIDEVLPVLVTKR